MSQELYDLLTPHGSAPKVESLEGVSLLLLEVNKSERPGKGRWWAPDGKGYTDQLDRAGLYSVNSREVTEHDTLLDNYRLVDARVIEGPLKRIMDMYKQLPDSEALKEC